MDTQPHTEILRAVAPVHERDGRRFALRNRISFSPQTRHKLKATKTYNQGFLRVTEEGILVAKTTPKGRFFP